MEVKGIIIRCIKYIILSSDTKASYIISYYLTARNKGKEVFWSFFLTNVLMLTTFRVYGYIVKRSVFDNGHVIVITWPAGLYKWVATTGGRGRCRHEVVNIEIRQHVFVNENYSSNSFFWGKRQVQTDLWIGKYFRMSWFMMKDCPSRCHRYLD